MVDHLIIKSDGTYTNKLYGHEYYESPEHLTLLVMRTTSITVGKL